MMMMLGRGMDANRKAIAAKHRSTDTAATTKNSSSRNPSRKGFIMMINRGWVHGIGRDGTTAVQKRHRRRSNEGGAAVSLSGGRGMGGIN
jgi:hypothetical protein